MHGSPRAGQAWHLDTRAGDAGTASLGDLVHRWLVRRRLFWTYLVLAGGLAVAGALTPPVPAAILRSALALLTSAAVVVGIRWLRPDQALGWWLIAAGTVISSGSTIAAAFTVVRTGELTVIGGNALLPALLGHPLLIAGVALLANLGGRRQWSDLLDAAMITLAVFLVTFALIIQPVLPTSTYAFTVVVLLPVGTLLLLTAVFWLVLSTWPPTGAVWLLALSMIARVAASASVEVPALAFGELVYSPLTAGLGMLSFILLGAAALHPSLAATRRRRRPGRASSRRRVLILVALAVVAPVALVAEVQEAVSDPHRLGATVPTVAASALLVLLVARLGVTANMAQRRADELARRTADLSESVREQEALQRQLRYQALHDPLTGLANRIVLTERMEWALTRPTGTHRYSLALFDLDRFKDVNDTFGHTSGDEVLVEVTHRLLALAPPGATLVRLSGDEFAVLLEETTGGEARRWAEQVLDALRRPYRVAGQEVTLSASVGLFSADPDNPPPTPSEALRDADLALYAAKAGGRDRVHEFEPSLRAARMQRSRLHSGLRRALTQGEFKLHYQPVVDLNTGRAVTVEALLRWEPPDAPPVPPADFIPIAEETGLIDSIGAWVLKHACRDASLWYRQHGVTVAVNVSGRQLDDPDFADQVLTALRQAGLPGEALVIEVTESSLVATSTESEAMRQLRRLRGDRIRIAIDDFGTGYSSLAYVSRLPVDMVKLDRSFIRRTGELDGEGWAFTRAILHLVEAMRLQAVAEGVETLEQAEALRALNCHLVQGYLFGRPMPREMMTHSLSLGYDRQRARAR